MTSAETGQIATNYLAEMAAAPLRIVYVATRFPKPATTGRMVMILQTLNFCRRLGEVHLYYSDLIEGDSTLLDELDLASVEYLPKPSYAGSIFEILRRPKAPLQSYLIGGRAATRQLVAGIGRISPDVVMFDMIRTSSFAEAVRAAYLDLPIVLDLDDLLSQRYERMLKAGNTEILSVYGQNLPRAIRALTSYIPRLLLRIERGRIARRERSAPDIYDAMTMVSTAEAETLAANMPDGFPIRAIPPIFRPIARDGACVPELGSDRDEIRFTFIGNAFHYGNSQALLELDRLAGRLTSELGANYQFSFHAAGQINPGLKIEHVKQHGFVENLSQFLAGRTVMVVPLRIGTGIKLKMLDAFASGVPVLTTDVGVESLSLEAGTHFIRGQDETNFQAIITDIILGRIGSSELGQIGRAARELIARRHDAEAVFANFRNLITGAIKRRKSKADQCS